MPACSNEIAGQLCGWLAWLGHVLLTWPSETTPVGAVLLTPFAALAFFALRRVGQLRSFRYRRVFLAILSRRYLGHRSHVLDVILMTANMGLFALICGQAVISMTAVSAAVHFGLTAAFGDVAPTVWPLLLVGAIWTLALFLAYEFAYWVDHYLSHHIPFLWEFHKVHHTAEVLSPLTNFRVHPVDSLVFVNIVMVTNGLMAGLLHYGFGAGPVTFEFFNLTTLVALAVSVFAQLQHTHIWLPITGFWGRLVLSPAHHQIHHSVDVAHHNRNFGNLIAVFDWAWGTLHVPSKQRQKLVFGLSERQNAKHDLTEGLLQPFVDAAKHLVPVQTMPVPATRDAGRTA
jgi:sterol desaturase/sphingolipid hydroxylase (fatty acid hydroxylase superfamily)